MIRLKTDNVGRSEACRTIYIIISINVRQQNSSITSTIRYYMNSRDKDILNKGKLIIEAGLRIIEKEMETGNEGQPWPEDSPEMDYLNGAKEGLLKFKRKMRR